MSDGTGSFGRIRGRYEYAGSADSTTTTDPSATTVPAAAADVAGGLNWVKQDSARLISDPLGSLEEP